MRWVMRLVTGLVVVLVLAAPLYWFFFLDSSAPQGQFTIDVAEVRRLAKSIEGELPSEIHVETVGQFEFPGIAVVAGNSWSALPMGVFSYQVISPTRRLLIDTTMNEATAKANEGKHFDTAAFARVVAAMNEVETIIVTHEHFDHLGGLAAQPNLSALLAKTKLTAEQVGSLPDSIKPGTWPAAGLQGYPPLVTGALFALAPGVVLIKSPGHTPGSQMVYVQRADGVEYLFIGDVAWSKENIDRVRGRAGLVSQFFLKEDRAAVIRQLAQLHRLSQAEPSVHIVPGHDLATIEALKNGLLLADHFVQPRP